VTKQQGLANVRGEPGSADPSCIRDGVYRETFQPAKRPSGSPVED